MRHVINEAKRGRDMQGRRERVEIEKEENERLLKKNLKKTHLYICIYIYM